MDQINCPHCKKAFTLTDAFIKNIEAQVRETEEERLKLKLDKIKQETQVNAFKEVEKEFKLQLETLKKDTENKTLENKKLLSNLEKLTDEIRELRQKLEYKDLEVKKTLLVEEEKIRQDALKLAEEKASFEKLELQKKLDDTNKALVEATRKASQTSQQLQGEVVELDILEKLKTSFIYDEILEIEKGVNGADILITVKNKKGTICGTVLIESKRAKAFSRSWIDKLKTDLRSGKHNVGLLISTTLPKDMTTKFSAYEGIFISDLNNYVPLIYILRQKLIEVAYQKYISEKSTDKKGEIYDYITSHEFHQQVEQMTESYREQLDQINKERAVYERIWKKREESARRLLNSTANIYGSLQGIAGSSMPEVSSLDFNSDFDTQKLIND